MSEDPGPRRFRIGGDFIVTVVLAAVVLTILAALVSRGVIPMPHIFGLG
ncbi:MAG TPA: hypothetical protein VGF71_08345 [Caulobacteraceae bacterium]|jgi:hypothetical protein